MTFTAEQEALRDGVRKLLAKEPEPWPALCTQIGVTGLAIPERHGGAGAGTAELQIVAEELGRVLSDVPFLGTSVATHAVLHTEDEQLMTRLAEGAVATLAWPWAPDSTCTVSKSTVDGLAPYVLDGDIAEILLVVTDTGALVEVDPSSVKRVHTPAMDETRRLATITFDRTPARLLGTIELGRLRDFACALLAAEQAGTAARALEITVEYTRQRHQFGRPIGSFQALKHRMADLHVLVETARSAAYAAPTSSRLAAVAKVHCTEALSAVAAEMIQLHGGIAITWEHPAHRYFKRAHSTSQLFGAVSAHLARVRP